MPRPNGDLEAAAERLATIAEATAAMAPMLREIREVMYLPDDDPRRQAAIAEKLRVLELVERSKRRKDSNEQRRRAAGDGG